MTDLRMVLFVLALTRLEGDLELDIRSKSIELRVETEPHHDLPLFGPFLAFPPPRFPFFGWFRGWFCEGR